MLLNHQSLAISNLPAHKDVCHLGGLEEENEGEPTIRDSPGLHGNGH